MKVSELARRTGVSAHRLRHYEALGLIAAERTGAGYRAFDERVVREVIFIAMSRDLGFSLKDIADTLPRYRAGTLTFDQMIERMRDRIGEVDRQIATQRALRTKLVAHIAWLQKRKRASAQSAERTPAPLRAAWPATRKVAR
jgi:MerR family transcriptional regulator, copper efflux regulator